MTVILVLLLGLFYGAETASAFYNPQAGRWLNRDPFEEQPSPRLEQISLNESNLDSPLSESARTSPLHKASLGNPYRYVSNDSTGLIDPLGLWELRCRLLSGVLGKAGYKHCWVECEGHSYSLLSDDGTATKHIDDPRDKGKGKIEQSGNGKCDCIAVQFGANSSSYQYKFSDCNAKYYAKSLLKCCGVSAYFPAGAGYPDACVDKAHAVECACGPWRQ